MRQASGMIIFKDLKTKRTIRKMRPSGYDRKMVSFRSEDAGSEILTYEVALDMHAISVMATKAGGNRTGRAKSGPVTVVITKREPVPQTPFCGEASGRDAQALYNEGRRILSGLDPGKETKQ